LTGSGKDNELKDAVGLPIIFEKHEYARWNSIHNCGKLFGSYRILYSNAFSPQGLTFLTMLQYLTFSPQGVTFDHASIFDVLSAL